MRKIHSGRIIALAAVVTLTVMAVQGPLKPYREKLPEGSVDWDQGWIRASVTVPLKSGVPEAQARLQARRVAVMKAQAAALRIAMHLPVNSERRLDSYEALRIHVRGIVAGGEVTSEGLKGHGYELEYQVPINGVHGIASEVAMVTLPPPEDEPAPRKKAPAAHPKPAVPPRQASKEAKPESGTPERPTVASLAAFSSVTVDASDTGAKPAIQGRILDPDGNEVYGVKTVRPLVTRERTLARYVTKAPSEASSQGASWLAPEKLGAFPLALISPPQYLLAQRKPSERPRGREKAFVIHAERASGKLKSDIVVTRETAEQLRKLDAETGALTNGHVVVILRADVGGVESRRNVRTEKPVLSLASR